MDEEMKKVSMGDAQQALASVQAMTAKGTQRGAYSRGYAIGLALWAGALAATMGSWIWLVIFAGGLMAHVRHRNQKGAWTKEVHTKRDLWIVIGLSAPVAALYVGAYIGLTYYGWLLAPWIAGVVIAAFLFALTEMVYGPIRKPSAGGTA